MLQNIVLALIILSIIITTSVKAETEPFTFYPPGHLIKGSAAFEASTGSLAYEDNAPEILFPIKKAPAFANSQVFSPGGSGYKNTDYWWSNPVNFHYPWRDNFCEERSDADHSAKLCPSGWAHQGQDIRPSTKENAVYEVVAVEEATVWWLRPGVGGVGLQTLDRERRYVYLHMVPPREIVNGVSKEIKFFIGKKIAKGQVIGLVSQVSSAPTPVHLHFELLQKRNGYDGKPIEDWDGYVRVSPYGSLLRSYQRLIGSEGTQLEPPVVCAPNSTRCAPAYSVVYPKAALITCSADGTTEALSWCSGSTCSSAATCGPPSGTPPPDMASSVPHCAGIPVPIVTWTPKTALANPPKFDYTTVTVAQKKIHLFGPAAAGRHVTYDPTINSWSVMGPLPSGSLFPAIAATFKDAPYLYLQESGTPGIYVRRTDGTWNLVLVTKFWLTFNGLATSSPVATYILAPWYTAAHLYSFNPDTNIWIKFPDRLQGMASAIVYKDAGVYVFGGDDGSAVSMFDVPTNTWYNRSPLPEKVFSAAAILWKGGLVVVAGGTTSASVPIDTVRVYNPAADIWCSSPFALPKAMGQPTLQEIDGVLYVLSADGSLWEGIAK